MGFLPFVNQGGQRIVRWHRLVILWVALIVTSLLAAAAVSYVLMGNWWHFASFGIAWGVFNAAWVTGRGFNLPVEKLPSIR